VSRNSAFVVPALVVGVAAGVFLFRQSRDGCEVRWRVGEIDPRFNVTAYDVQNAASNAAAAWNAATDKRVLWYDKTDGVPLNLVYDVGHPAMAEYIRMTREIRRLDAEIENLTPQFEKNPSQYVADRINRSIDQYNRLVTSINQLSNTEIKQGSYQDHLEVYAFADTADLKFVIAHEFGHALGIGHVQAADAVMNARNKIGTVATFRLHDADIEALKKSCSR
jgi:hypothetical protein